MPRISELGFVSSGPLIGTELVAVVQNGDTVQTTAQEIANLAPGGGGGAVDSVNTQTGVVVLDAADVGATVDPSLLPGTSGLDGTEILTVEQGGVPVQVTTEQIAEIVDISRIAGDRFVEHKPLQIPQRSGKFVSEDGTFRDPLQIGDGTFAVGSPTLLVDDTKYNSFPLIRRMKNGQLLASFHKGDGHNVDNTGKLYGMIGAEGLDGAITWGAEFIIFQDLTPLSVISVGQRVLSDGRVVCSYSTRNGTTDPLDGARVIFSEDNGITWGSPITVNSSLTDFTYCSGSVTELPNGHLLLTVEGENIADTLSRMRLMKSTDGGLTWGNEVEIASGTRNYFEGQLHLLPDGRLMVLMRTGVTSGDIYSSFSSDSGATWSTPAVAFAGCGQPNVIQLNSGTLLAITRKATTFDIVAFASINNGATWGPEISIAAITMEYGCPVELFDERVLVLYGREVSSSNADLYTVYLTEGKARTNAVMPIITESSNGVTHNAKPGEAGCMVRYTGTGAKVCAFNSADNFVAHRVHHVANRSASGNVTLTPTGITLNAPKGGTLILEPGDTVTVLFVSSTVADVFGSTS